MKTIIHDNMFINLKNLIHAYTKTSFNLINNNNVNCKTTQRTTIFKKTIKLINAII